MLHIFGNSFSLIQLKRIRFWTLCALLTYVSNGCYPGPRPLKLHPLFSDHMVLQQETEVNLWGTGTPRDSVFVEAEWGQVSSNQINSDGTWTLKLQTPEHGGPYTLTFSTSDQRIVLKDVLLGEVWLTSGQSNMEWPMNARINNGKQEVQNASNPKIRMFNMPRNLDGVSIEKASWKTTSPENAKQFSAVAYFFAREINRVLNIPVGIVNSSWGGTRIESWISFDKLLKNPFSYDEATQILQKGGLDGLKKQMAEQNNKIETANKEFLGSENYPLPKNIEEWLSLSLDDQIFTDPLFEDSNWTEYPMQGKDNSSFTFEKVFNPDSFSENGVLWIRKYFDVKDPSQKFKFITNGGIDDLDYTYINGRFVGKSLACCIDREYKIPKGVLKKTGNVLAIRVVDYVGEGGFLGTAFIESEKEQIRVDNGPLKFKHIAFSLDSHLQKHELSHKYLTTKDDTLKRYLEKGKLIENPNTYSVLFESMIKPLIPYTLKGLLWYQGESNVDNPHEYTSFLTTMIDDWRAQWGDQLPFYFVQIAPCGTYKDNEESFKLREAQRKALDINNTAMVVTLDIGEEDNIHPANKQDVGLRLANIALNKNYNQKEIVPSGPVYKSFFVQNQTLILYFEELGSGLYAPNKLKGFELAGIDGKFYPATAKIVENTIQLVSKKVKAPIEARYGWANYFDATLFNKEGLPASSFQTEKNKATYK